MNNGADWSQPALTHDPVSKTRERYTGFVAPELAPTFAAPSRAPMEEASAWFRCLAKNVFALFVRKSLFSEHPGISSCGGVKGAHAVVTGSSETQWGDWWSGRIKRFY